MERVEEGAEGEQRLRKSADVEWEREWREGSRTLVWRVCVDGGRAGTRWSVAPATPGGRAVRAPWMLRSAERGSVAAK